VNISRLIQFLGFCGWLLFAGNFFVSNHFLYVAPRTSMPEVGATQQFEVHGAIVYLTDFQLWTVNFLKFGAWIFLFMVFSTVVIENKMKK
jgi:hypothetical protein